jgi:hypothetical protein
VITGVFVVGTLARSWSQRKQSALVERARLEPEASGKARILTFYGPSCDACERQKLVLTELQAERPEQFTIELRDASTDYDYARKFGLVIVPTTVVIRPDGAISGINSGLISREALEAQLSAA